MKTRVIQTRLMPRGHIIAITLFGLVFTREHKFINKYVLNHELIHCRQQLELLYLPFYILYVGEWIVRLIQYRRQDQAYRNISFEREAYSNEKDLEYQKRRRPYAWCRYLKKNG